MHPAGQSRLEQALAFKAFEIEELADRYFFRPLGAGLARVARRLGLTPIEVTLGGAGVGVLAGALLYDERLAFAGFLLLLVHGILDSADGQLARMTGRVSELGRVLDGLGGYVTHLAAYLAIVAAVLAHGGPASIVVAGVAAGAATAVQAQLYDYHRTAYAAIAIKGVMPQPARIDARWARGLLRWYDAMQHGLVGRHDAVVAAIAARSPSGRVAADDRARYRACFYWPVRGWNLLGDNTRFYAIGVLAWFHRLPWFFAFILGPMNVALGLLCWWQARADRRFTSACDRLAN